MPPEVAGGEVAGGEGAGGEGAGSISGRSEWYLVIRSEGNLVSREFVLCIGSALDRSIRERFHRRRWPSSMIIVWRSPVRKPSST